jgi:arylsulfatase A-like enzyme
VSKPALGWDLTPNLRKRLAPHGTYFTRAYSQAPWTMPAFASIFTGLYPEEHGAQEASDRLMPHRLTLAEILRESGYLTMAVVSGNFVSSSAGMLQGFDITDESQVVGRDGTTSVEVTTRTLDLLDAHGDQPFFMFVHYFDPHRDYLAHEGFDLAESGDRRALPPRPDVTRRPESYVLPPGLEQLKALYAEEIAFTDHSIGRLLAYLDERRLWDSTCVVFVSDHGEEFFDHGGLEHGHTVFDELVHVPLFVADPTRHTSASVDDVVETRWLFGTLLEILGRGRLASGETTHDLFSPSQDGAHSVRSSLHGKKSCLVGRQYKLIKSEPMSHTRARIHRVGVAGRAGRGPGRDSGPAKETMLFDLLADPGEDRELSDELPELSRQLRSDLDALDERIASRSDTTSAPVSDRDHLREIKDLGYL